ncbi:hypothetical protein [Microcoleus sp. herbarium12]|uniref:hypothetical protein n=1 Tax=Microcoleus sp. herbarium12 TaxID=3055437 RepID=UPI002FD1228D
MQSLLQKIAWCYFGNVGKQANRSTKSYAKICLNLFDTKLTVGHLTPSANTIKKPLALIHSLVLKNIGVYLCLSALHLRLFYQSQI